MPRGSRGHARRKRPGPLLTVAAGPASGTGPAVDHRSAGLGQPVTDIHRVLLAGNSSRTGYGALALCKGQKP